MLNKKFLLIGFILIGSFFQVIIAQPYQVGNLVTNSDGSQGVVFFVHPDGSGGWMVALNDASTGCSWGTTTDIPNLTSISPTLYPGTYTCQYAALYDTAGYSNTQKIRTFQNNNPTYAAGKVDFDNGWYLPSMGQLSILYGSQPLINNALLNAGGMVFPSTVEYWSSSEFDFFRSWCLSCYWGTPVYNDKTLTYLHVRAVRSFTNQSIVGDTTLTYLWNTGSTQPDITQSPTTSTTYTVTVTSGSGCTNNVSQTIFVNSTIPQTIYDTVCVGYPYHENGFNISASALMSPGIFYFTDTLSTQYGCDSIVLLILNIFGTPNITILASPEVICSGDTTHLVAIDTGTTSTTIYYPPIVAIGDILCTDSTIVKPTNWPVPGKTAMGVVFYVDTTGMHGWAVHLQNQSTGIVWATSCIDIPSLLNYYTPMDAIMDLDGYSNTLIIRATGSASAYPAAWAVDINNGWYLPAVGQLRKLYGVSLWINPTLQIVGGTQFSGRFCSSTEVFEYGVWALEYVGGLINYGKTDYSSLRSIRNF